MLDFLGPELFGLVLAGGESLRMGFDKGTAVYPKLSSLTQEMRHFWTLERFCKKTFLSVRKNQKSESLSDVLFDDPALSGGPGAGILSAHLHEPRAAWLVLACDFPFADREAVGDLVNQRQGSGVSTAYRNGEGIIEPLYAIWEPETLGYFLEKFKKGEKSCRRALEETGAFGIYPKNPKTLINVNSPEEVRRFSELAAFSGS